MRKIHSYLIPVISSVLFFPLVEIKCVVHVQYPPLVWSGSSSLGLRQEVGEGGGWLVGWVGILYGKGKQRGGDRIEERGDGDGEVHSTR